MEFFDTEEEAISESLGGGVGVWRLTPTFYRVYCRDEEKLRRIGRGCGVIRIGIKRRGKRDQFIGFYSRALQLFKKTWEGRDSKPAFCWWCGALFADPNKGASTVNVYGNDVLVHKGCASTVHNYMKYEHFYPGGNCVQNHN